MKSYFIAQIEVDSERDLSAYALYVEAVRPIVERYGGRYLVRTDKICPLFSDWRPDRLIIIEFTDRETAEKCFSSPEYRAVMELRESSVTARGIIADGLTE